MDSPFSGTADYGKFSSLPLVLGEVGWGQLSRWHTSSEVQTCVHSVSVFREGPLKAVMCGMRAFEALVLPLWSHNERRAVSRGVCWAVGSIIPLHTRPHTVPQLPCPSGPASASELGPR